MLRGSICSDFSGPTGDTRLKGLTFSKFLTLRCNSVLNSRKQKGELLPLQAASSLLSPAAGTSMSTEVERDTHRMSRGYLCPHAEIGT